MRIARDVLARRGLIENISFSFLSKNDGNLFLGDSISIELDNPISDDLSMMRPSLIPNLINCISKNKRKGFFNNSIFEVSSVFYGIEEDKQISCAAAVREGHISNRHWSENARDVDIFDVKSDALEILEALAINTKKITLSKNAPEWYHPGRSASINLGKLNLGFFGELHPRLAQRYEMRPVFFEIFTDKIPGKSIEKVKPEFVPYNLMPLTRDFAFWIDNELSSQEIVNTIIKVGIKNELLDITNVSIFDIYEDNFHKDKKSIAVEVQLQPTKKTLTDKEIQEISDLIVRKLSKNYGAVLRK